MNIAGKKVVFTGCMPQSRHEAEQIAKSMGAEVGRHIDKDTEILILGTPSPREKMAKKAKEMGLQIIDRDQWTDMSSGYESVIRTYEVAANTPVGPALEMIWRNHGTIVDFNLDGLNPRVTILFINHAWAAEFQHEYDEAGVS